MSTNKLYRIGAAPVLLMGLAAPMFVSGCDDDPTSCDFAIEAKATAFVGAVDALVEISGEIKGNIAEACAGIATDLGGSPPAIDKATVTDDDLKAACTMANDLLAAKLEGGVEISILIEGGKCEVAASAQIDCEASCSVDGSCEPGTLEVRCDPGELSGECSAECSGSCTAEGGSVECAGSCSAECSGECSGGCEGTMNGTTCEGKCTGTCTGGCSGTCSVVPPSATCSGSCKGGCSVDYTAPSCEGEMTPPSCDIEADCKGGCDAQGSLKAECTPPTITIVGDAELKATLEKWLPQIWLLFKTQGKLVAEAALYVGETAFSVAGEFTASLGCVASFGAEFVGKFSAAAEASVSVSVSVEASAEVGGTAGG